MSAAVVNATRPVVITGGAGFIGSNLANRLLGLGKPVLIFDNLSRAGVERNLAFLRERHGARVEVVIADIRDASQVKAAVRRASAVYHLAAQVAVTTSLDDPRTDFEINAGGTLNVLEALRECNRQVPLLYTSTNKVYGAINEVPLHDIGDRCEPVIAELRETGFGESRPLDFYSPYGCSKGSADQLVRDYARSFGLSTVVFRMSCIYGPHQFGNEDQGWVAHFIQRAMRGEEIVIYGDGRQVRDILFVEDLLDAMLLATAESKRIAGGVFNIGGGPTNTISLLELIDQIESLTGDPCRLRYEPQRLGDQRYYVSDFSSFRATTGWVPKTDTRTGIAKLAEWVTSLRHPVRLVRQDKEAVR